VSRHPELVPPVSGSFIATPSDNSQVPEMSVLVEVDEIPAD